MKRDCFQSAHNFEITAYDLVNQREYARIKHHQRHSYQFVGWNRHSTAVTLWDGHPKFWYCQNFIAGPLWVWQLPHSDIGPEFQSPDQRYHCVSPRVVIVNLEWSKIAQCVVGLWPLLVCYNAHLKRNMNVIQRWLRLFILLLPSIQPTTQSKPIRFFFFCVYFIKFLFVYNLFFMLRQHSCFYPMEYAQVNTTVTKNVWIGIL